MTESKRTQEYKNQEKIHMLLPWITPSKHAKQITQIKDFKGCCSAERIYPPWTFPLPYWTSIMFYCTQPSMVTYFTAYCYYYFTPLHSLKCIILFECTLDSYLNQRGFNQAQQRKSARQFRSEAWKQSYSVTCLFS